MQNDIENPVKKTRPRKGFARRLTRAWSSLTAEPIQAPRPPGESATAGRAGIDAGIWQTYVSEALDFDKSLIASWNEDLDVLLIFAGLFSAVLTAFIIESRKDLQEDYSKTSAELLRILVGQAQNTTPLAHTVPSSFYPAPSSFRVNALWFASLGCSLISALAAMLGKQWVRQYTNNLLVGGGYRIRARRHQSALAATKHWKMSEVIRVIPLFMHIALFLFFAGLFIFLWGDHLAIIGTVVSICLVGIAFYVILTILPSIHHDCPFGTPFSSFIPKFSHDTLMTTDNDPLSRSDLDTKCLTWLMQSTNTSVVRSAAMAMSGLQGTAAQQEILARSGAFEAVARGIESCTYEDRGFLFIKHEDLDIASLLLFAALRLLDTSTYQVSPPAGHQALINLLRRFNLRKVIGFRREYDAADFAVAMWCLVAFNSLHQIYCDPQSLEHLASEFVETVQIPAKFRASTSSRIHKDLLPAAIELASSTSQDNPQLFAWAIEAMFTCWRNEGLPVVLGEVGNGVISRAIITTYPGTEKSVLLTMAERLNINDGELISTGAIVPISHAIQSNKSALAIPAMELLRCIYPSKDIIGRSTLKNLPEAVGRTNSGMDSRSTTVNNQHSEWTKYLVALAEALNASDPAVVSASMITFEKILSHAFVRGIAIPTASIGLIVKILDFDLYSISPHLLSLLFRTMVHEVNRATAIQAGAIQVLVKALDRYPQTDLLFVNYTLSRGTKVLVNSALRALSTMTEHYDGVASVSAAGASAIGPILELAKSDQIQTAEPAIRTIVQIVKHDIGLHAVVAGGLIPLVQAFASYPTHTYPMWGILEKFSSSQGVDTVTTTEIESLLDLIKSEDSRLAISSFKLLALFLRHEKGVAVVIAAGAIDRLMAALRTPMLEEARSALSAILAHEIGVDAVTAHLERNPQTVKGHSVEEINVMSSIGSIVKILDFDLYSINPYLVSLLFTTMVHEVHQATAIKAGAMQVLVKALGQQDGGRTSPSDYTLFEAREVIVSSAIGALSMMAEQYDGVASILAAGAIGPILEVVRSNRSGAAESAIRMLVQFVQHDVGIHAIIANGLVPLVQAITSYSTSLTDMDPMCILEKISSSQGVDTVTTTEIESLLDLIKSEDSRLAISSFKLLALFLCHEKGVAVVIAAGAIDRLMAALRTPHLLEEVWLALNAILAHDIGVDAVTAYLERNPQTVKCNSVEEINFLSKLSRSQIAMDAILTTEVLQKLLGIARHSTKKRDKKQLIHGGTKRRNRAIEALLMISNSDDGLHAIIAAGARHFVPRPGEDRDSMAVKLYDRILSFCGVT